MTPSRAGGLFAAVLVSLFAVTTAFAADPPLDEVHTLSSGSTPAEHAFDIPTAGAYHLAVSDVNAAQTNTLSPNQPLTSAKVAITSGSTVIVTTSIGGSDRERSVGFNVTQAGKVVIRVVGTPAASRTGSVNTLITRDSDSSVINQFTPAFAPPNTVPDYRIFVEEKLTPATNGTYSVELEDMSFPVAMTGLKGLVLRTGSATPLALLDVPAGQPTATFSVTAGDSYTVGVVGNADQTAVAGLIGLRVRDTATGALVLSRVLPVGRVFNVGSVALAAGAQTLAFTDFQFPVALVQGGALVAINGSMVAKTTTAGSVDFTAAAGTHQVYALAAASTGNSGAYGIDVRPQGGASLFFTAQGVGDAHNFAASIATAGAYRLRAADFNFPGALSKVNVLAAQGGVKLDALSAVGSLNLPNVAAGQLFLVAIATPATASGGLLGMDLAPSNGGAAIFETTQGVGNLWDSRKATITDPGKYRVNATDLKFPAAFQEFAVIVTRGIDTTVSIFGSDRSDFDATVGNYTVNFLARPAAAESAGTYGLRVALAPAVPTITTFTATPPDASVGGTVRLDWAATGATSCTASGGWSGTKAVSGSETSSPISATTTFTIRCDGDGGSSMKSVTVNAVSQANDGGGGGGALGWLSLLGLVVAGGIRRLSYRSRLLAAA